MFNRAVETGHGSTAAIAVQVPPVKDICALSMFLACACTGAVIFGQGAYYCLRRQPYDTGRRIIHWPTRRVPYLLTAGSLVFWFMAFIWLLAMVVLIAVGVIPRDP